ncbi:MAG: homocysteine S-methyltransferase family protein [Sphingomonadaceae bacterium]
MSRYRSNLPQLDGGLFLTDAGLETDLIFHHGFDIPAFAAHTLLADEAGRVALARYFEAFLRLAAEIGAGFILDSQTWRAHPHWAGALGVDEAALEAATADSIAFIAGLRDRHSASGLPIVLNGILGPCGDAYRPEIRINAGDAEAYFARPLRWLADAGVDMVTALTFNQSGEATGFVRAARALGLPAVVSFTVETDGRLPDGMALADAIEAVDAATQGAAAYYMLNCAHPDHFADVLDPDAPWVRRIRGIRANASRRSHAELDEATELDDGDPVELAGLYRALRAQLPWLNVVGGCCGSDLRHVTAIARTLTA